MLLNLHKTPQRVSKYEAHDRIRRCGIGTGR